MRVQLLKKPPWANRWLLLGVTLPVLLHLSVLYTPSLATIFQLAPLTKQDWPSVALFARPATAGYWSSLTFEI